MNLIHTVRPVSTKETLEIRDHWSDVASVVIITSGSGKCQGTRLCCNWHINWSLCKAGMKRCKKHQEASGLYPSSDMHMYYAFDNYIYSFPSMTTYLFLVGRHISFPSFMPIITEVVHTCVSIQITNGHEVLTDRYFTFVSHIFS